MFLAVGINSLPTIAVAPINTAGVEGNTVTLYCTWQDTGEGNVQWFNHIGAGSGEIITDGETIKGEPSKYGLTGNHAGGEYNLQIKSLSDADVGDYACFTQLNIVRYGAYVMYASK